MLPGFDTRIAFTVNLATVFRDDTDSGIPEGTLTTNVLTANEVTIK